MAKIEIYTRPLCGYCARAIALLNEKSVAFTEIAAGMDVKKRNEMTQRSGGGKTFPQIFINSLPIGGFDDMYALEKSGKLDALLAQGEA